MNLKLPLVSSVKISKSCHQSGTAGEGVKKSFISPLRYQETKMAAAQGT